MPGFDGGLLDAVDVRGLKSLLAILSSADVPRFPAATMALYSLWESASKPSLQSLYFGTLWFRMGSLTRASKSVFSSASTLSLYALWEHRNAVCRCLGSWSASATSASIGSRIMLTLWLRLYCALSSLPRTASAIRPGLFIPLPTSAMTLRNELLGMMWLASCQ
ncbi:hypothetical protein BHS05_25215 [Myxococcus xanthus]|nr:hypothetical protein BHS05_25215 [Myxococcus xanthus]